VYREKFVGKIVDGRQESRRNRHKPEPIERQPPPVRRMADTAQVPPAASVESSNAHEHGRHDNLQHGRIIVSPPHMEGDGPAISRTRVVAMHL
jgi:hypothetical protein